MDEQEIRLECLRMALNLRTATNPSIDVISEAQRFYDFVHDQLCRYGEPERKAELVQ